MVNLLANLYCDRQNEGEPQSKILLYQFEHITKNGRMCLTMISFSQAGFMESRVQ
jgi:hypothetical protein